MVVVDVKKGPVDALNVCALISFFLFFFLFHLHVFQACVCCSSGDDDDDDDDDDDEIRGTQTQRGV